MAKAATTHHTVTLELCSGFCASSRGCRSDQYRQLCLFTKPVRWKCASSLIIRLLKTSLFLFMKSNICWLKTNLLAASPSSSFWKTWILYGWKCKSKCKIRLTLLSDSPSVLEWRTADRRGLRSNDALTVSMFCGVQTVLTRPSFFVTVVFKFVYRHLYGMSWWHFTVLMNPEFLAKFTLGGTVAIIVLIKWFYTVHQSMTPFHIECYSRPHHLAVSFAFPAHAKNRKTPLPNRPIHWQTLYIYIYIYEGKVIPLQARCGPEGSRRFRLPDFPDIQHMKVVRLSASRTGRLYPQECSWYSVSLGAGLTPGPWCGQKEICHWKIQWHRRESTPGLSD